MAAQTIVILGAGFGGIEAARHLSALLPESETCDIVLVDRHNYSLFTPMLTEVASGQVDADEIVVAVRSLGPRVRFEQGDVTSIDPKARTVTITIGDPAQDIPQTRRTIRADHLVIALGSVNNFHHIPGLQEHSIGIKSVDDAAAIRSRAVALLERADEEPDAAERRALLTFVVGGGGFSGVETMAAVNDMVRDLAEKFPRVQPHDIRTVIAHPADRLLPELDAGLAAYAQKELQRRGVEVRLQTEVSGAGADYVEVKDSKNGKGERIYTHTIIWTGGVKPNPVIDSAGVKLGKHHGIVVDGCCRVQGHPHVWALGDCAEVPKPGGKGTYAPTAQNATREGAQVARNIAAVMRGGDPQPFDYHPIGELAVVGKRAGVASLYGVHISGIAAWAMWRMVYLAKLPSLPKRLRVGFDWVMDLATGRDVVDTHTAVRDGPPHSGQAQSAQQPEKEKEAATASR